MKKKEKKSRQARPELKSVFKSQENNDIGSLLKSKNPMFRTMRPKKKYNKVKAGKKISKKLFLRGEFPPKRNNKIQHNRMNNLDLRNFEFKTNPSSRMKSSRSRTPSRKQFSIQTDRL